MNRFLIARTAGATCLVVALLTQVTHAWGNADFSPLGDGTTTSRRTPALAWSAPGRWSPPVLSLATGNFLGSRIVTPATPAAAQWTLTAPTADLDEGVYRTAQAVTLHGPVGATIRYTTDGSEPTVTSQTASASIRLDQGSTVLKARAFQDGWTASDTLTRRYTLDWTAPTVSVWTPLENELRRNPSITIEGAVDDGESTVDAVSCNSAAAEFSDGMFSCTVMLAQGSNEVQINATDVAGNLTSVNWRVRFDGTFSLVVHASPELPSSSWITLSADANAPDGVAISYQWTQLAGAPLALLGATSPTVSFLTPAIGGPVQLQLVATAGGETRTAVAESVIKDMTDRLMLTADPLAGHESTLEVTGTSLVYPFTWRGAGHPLQVVLGAPDAATLDTTDEDDPLRITLETLEHEPDVTAMFTYDAQLGGIALNAADQAAFQDLLSPEPMTLRIGGVDSEGRPVWLGVSLLHGRVDMAGQVIGAPGSSASVAGLAVVLKGTKRGYRAAVQTDALGAFRFDGLIDDVYAVSVVDSEGHVGLELLDLENAPGEHAVRLEMRE